MDVINVKMIVKLNVLNVLKVNVFNVFMDGFWMINFSVKNNVVIIYKPLSQVNNVMIILIKIAFNVKLNVVIIVLFVCLVCV